MGKSYTLLLLDKKNSDPAAYNIFKCSAEHVKHKNYMAGRKADVTRLRRLKNQIVFSWKKGSSGFMWAVVVQFHTSQEKSLLRLRKISVER